MPPTFLNRLLDTKIHLCLTTRTRFTPCVCLVLYYILIILTYGIRLIIMVTRLNKRKAQIYFVTPHFQYLLRKQIFIRHFIKQCQGIYQTSSSSIMLQHMPRKVRVYTHFSTSNLGYIFISIFRHETILPTSPSPINYFIVRPNPRRCFT